LLWQPPFEYLDLFEPLCLAEPLKTAVIDSNRKKILNDIYQGVHFDGGGFAAGLSSDYDIPPTSVGADSIFNLLLG
jgi:hypothetical protein